MKLAAKFLALALSLFLPGIALATGRVTGGIECSIKDANLDFSFNARFDYAGNSALFAVGGNFVSKNPKTYQLLRKFPLTDKTLLQQWFYDRQLNLQIYSEVRNDDDPFASVDLGILTTMVPDGDDQHYTGTYTLTIQPPVSNDGSGEDPFDVSGKVSCSSN
jgi:hypothetical protein